MSTICVCMDTIHTDCATSFPPFASFKQALFDYPGERDAWFEFQNEHMLEEVREFLRLNEIEFEEA